MTLWDYLLKLCWTEVQATALQPSVGRTLVRQVDRGIKDHGRKIQPLVGRTSVRQQAGIFHAEWAVI